MLISYWLLSQLVRIGAATFEANMLNHYPDVTKKQFQQQLTAPPHKNLYK